MTQVMVYIILLSAAIAAVAATVDALSGSGRGARRWTWLGALVLLVPLTAYVMLAPKSVVELEAATGALVELPLASGTLPALDDQPSIDWTPALDRAAVVGWALMSALLLVAIGIGQWRIARARRNARRAMVQGRSVLLTEDLGPAVAGIAEPVVLVPRWVSALDDASQQLLLAHEFEHVRHRDTSLLMTGALVTAVVPWNPVAWWLARQLRIAVEMDCDRRVLSAHPAVRRYADLLLVAAGRNRLATRLLAAHFGEYTSDLERRIRAMTENRWQVRSLVVTGLASLALIAVSCEVPRPDPISPSVRAEPETPPGAIIETEVERPVAIARGSVMPQYPDILRQAGVQGAVQVRFRVDATGKADMASLEILHSTHELFAMAVRKTLPDMEFTPAVAGGKAVAHVVEQPFTFNIVGSERVAEVPAARRRGDALQRVVVTGVPGRKLAYTVERKKDEPGIVVRRPGDSAEQPHILVRSYTGAELRRYDPAKLPASQNPLAELNPADIESVEVIKGAGCGTDVGCPAIIVTVKRGRESAYKR